jgi:hypothetical protein
MATSDYWSSADLKAISSGGWIKQDVMAQIWDASKAIDDTPFADAIGSGSVGNSYAEWLTDNVGAVNMNNAVVDGADAGTNDAKGGARVGNQCQESTKVVMVTDRAIQSETIGGDALAYQLKMRTRELHRDVEAISLSIQASVADDGNTTAGKAGGFGAWLKTNVSRGATGSSGGFSSGTVAAPVPGTARALSFATLKTVIDGAWTQGGKPSILMSLPSVIKGLSEYMFTSTAQIATLMSDAGQSKSQMVAKGSVNVFVSDFGVTLTMVPNRTQQLASAGCANLYVIDPDYVQLGYLQNYQTKPLARTGLAEKREIFVDWTVKVLSETAQGVVADLNPTAAVVA